MTEGLVALVKTKSNITSIIGSSPARIYPIFLPAGLTTYPSITFRVINIEDNKTFDGASTYDFVYVDIFFYGATAKAAKDLSETFRTEIEDTVGTYASVQIDHIWFNGGGAEDYLDDLKLYTKQLEFKIAIRR